MSFLPAATVPRAVAGEAGRLGQSTGLPSSGVCVYQRRVELVGFPPAPGLLGAQTSRPVANTLLAQALDPMIKLPMSGPRSAALGKLLGLSVPQFPPLSNGSNPTGPLSLNHNSKVQKTLRKPNVPLATHLVAKSNRIEMSLLMALAYPPLAVPWEVQNGRDCGGDTQPSGPA